MIFKTDYRLMQVKVLQNAPRGAFCNTLTSIKLPFVIKTFVLSIFERPFYTGFTVVVFCCRYSTSPCCWLQYHRPDWSRKRMYHRLLYGSYRTGFWSGKCPTGATDSCFWRTGNDTEMFQFIASAGLGMWSVLEVQSEQHVIYRLMAGGRQWGQN